MNDLQVKDNSAPKWLIIAAFGAVYIIWGSTYLGIKYAIETLPPFLMAGIRFLIAGIILYVIALFQKTPTPTRSQWKSSSIIGALLLLLGNGMVVWAEHFIDSGTAALLITIEPIWIVILSWLFTRKKPSVVILIAMMLGITGMVLLTGPGTLAGFKTVDMRGVAGLVFATLCWAIGSLYTVKADVPDSPFMSTALQLITGGAMLTLAGSLLGEWSQIHMENFSEKSVLAFVYLIIFGSLIGYTAYSFLLKHAPPGQVATYAYVNPVVAVYLGWAMAGEAVTWQTMVASMLLVIAVAIITRFSEKKESKEAAQTSFTGERSGEVV